MVILERKRRYAEKLQNLLREYKHALIITVDMVGSSQIQQTRIALRGRGEILMGKNTMIRRILREFVEEDPRVEALIEAVQGNCGLVFTNCDLKEIREEVTSNKKPAAAKAGVIAPQSVTVPPGPTGMDPGQTSFFQALNIATKISRGQIEIVNPVYLIQEGDRVGSSEAALLSKLDIRPFAFGIKVARIYSEGAVFTSKILDITSSDLVSKFFSGIRVLAALGLACGIPNLATVPHNFANAFKKLLAISIQTEYSFESSQKYKDFLADPEAYAAAHGLNLGGGGGGGGGEEKKEEAAAPAAPQVEEEDEESEAAGALFGDDSDSSSEEESD